MEFKNIEELYMRVLPALEIKQNELSKQNINITSKDIFEYLKKNRWVNAHNLSLYDIVSDILKLKIDDMR